VVKEGDVEGHRSLLTPSDIRSGERIVEAFDTFLNIKVLAEEKLDGPRMLSQKDPKGVFEGKVLVLDPLDGTTSFATRHSAEWCVGAGLMLNGEIIASAVTAPHANGGMLLFSTGQRVFFVEDDRFPRTVESLQAKPKTSAVVLRGVDTELYPGLLEIMPEIAANSLAVDIKGSGHFALMDVALNRAEVLIQAPQKPWDWVPVYHAVKAVGGTFRFFRIEDPYGAACFTPVERFDQRAFSSNPGDNLGFVAGEPTLVDEIWRDILDVPKNKWRRATKRGSPAKVAA